MIGHHVTRRFGWDCHGLPIEFEIDKKLRIKKREQVIQLDIDNYNEECMSIVTRYVAEWESTVTRLGRWIDFKNDYKTVDINFMESVWLCHTVQDVKPHYQILGLTLTIRLAKEDSYVQQCMDAFVEIVVSTLPGLVEAITGDILQMMGGRCHGHISTPNSRGWISSSQIYKESKAINNERVSQILYSQLPFFDNTMDLIHTTRFPISWINTAAAAAASACIEVIVDEDCIEKNYLFHGESTQHSQSDVNASIPVEAAAPYKEKGKGRKKRAPAKQRPSVQVLEDYEFLDETDDAGMHWTDADFTCLARAWVTSVQTNGHTKGFTFYQKVNIAFKKDLECPTRRSCGSTKSQWYALNVQCVAYKGTVAQEQFRNSSGKTEENWENDAHKIYKGLNSGNDFKHRETYKILPREPRWANLRDDGLNHAMNIPRNIARRTSDNSSLGNSVEQSIKGPRRPTYTSIRGSKF
ncbi:hypothetical protein GIB67_030927 [Kingdonia uniflora]|uniref:Aminoacyl-tRNA synthetase class Ia domain-containing protein n=1 Tax=Kingdonia uniflora TaxID=39325 RepID=A0A7J7L3J1_9MAGN|nr:hypothetical protein GIB67_030927 [Kingdonia uniflora]